MSKVLTAAVAAALAVCGGAAMAEYPDKPVTFLMGYSPGGGVDTGARTYIPHVEQCLGGEKFVYTYKPGSGGELAFAELAKSTPDGYTLGIINLPNVLTAPITKQTTWSIADFEPIGTVVVSRPVLAVPSDSPFKSLDEVVAAAKSSPTVMAVAGVGGDKHLMALDFAKAAGVTFTYAPFGGDSEARNAIMGGHTPVGSIASAGAVSLQDKLRILAISADERQDYLPEIPTFGELGYDVSSISHYHVMAAPKGTPQDILDKVSDCLGKVMNDPAFQEEAAKRNVLLYYTNPEDATALISRQDKTLKALWDEEPWVK